MNTLDLIEPQVSNVVCPAGKDTLFLLNSGWRFSTLPRSNILKVFRDVVCKLWRAPQRWQIVIASLSPFPLQLCFGLRHRGHRIVLLIQERHPFGFLCASDGVLHIEPRIITPIAHPQATDRLLAPVLDLGKLAGVSFDSDMPIGDIASGSIPFHTVTVSQLVSQSQFLSLETSQVLG